MTQRVRERERERERELCQQEVWLLVGTPKLGREARLIYGLGVG